MGNKIPFFGLWAADQGAEDFSKRIVRLQIWRAACAFEGFVILERLIEIKIPTSSSYPTSTLKIHQNPFLFHFNLLLSKVSNADFMGVVQFFLSSKTNWLDWV